MPKRYYETGEFETLKAQWYDKLKAAGFEDIEYERTGNIKHPVSLLEKKKIFTADYYRAATAWLNDRKWMSKLEKVMWKLHTDGVSEREILKHIVKKKLCNWKTKYKIWQFLNEERRLMLESKWYKNYINGTIRYDLD